MIRASAGTRSPARSTTRSPGTSSRAGIAASTPSRMACASRRGHLPQRLERPLGSIFLDEPEQHGEQHDDGDDGCLEAVPEQSGQQRRGEQDHDQDVLELRGERVPRGGARANACSSFGPCSPRRRRASSAVRPVSSAARCCRTSPVSRVCHGGVGSVLEAVVRFDAARTGLFSTLPTPGENRQLDSLTSCDLIFL